MAPENMDSTKKITERKSSSSSKSAFIKRRACLVKKAKELSVLCDSQVAVMGYSKDGKLFEFASSDMADILTRFEMYRRIKKGIPVKHDPKMEDDVLREEIDKLKLKEEQHVLGRDLNSMSREDLQELEQQLNEGLLCIKNRKEAILVQQLQQSRDNELQSTQENGTLRQKVENLERLCASISYQQPLLLEYQLMAQSNFALGQGFADPQLTCNTCTGDEDLVDVTLQLGPSTSKVCGKRKSPPEGR